MNKERQVSLFDANNYTLNKETWSSETDSSTKSTEILGSLVWGPVILLALVAIKGFIKGCQSAVSGVYKVA